MTMCPTPAVVAILVSALASPALGQSVIRVDAGATPGGDGLTWESAYADLQEALASESADEIWVAAGVYQPGEDRAASFCLRTGLAVYGGFAGVECCNDARMTGACARWTGRQVHGPHGAGRARRLAAISGMHRP